MCEKLWKAREREREGKRRRGRQLGSVAKAQRVCALGCWKHAELLCGQRGGIVGKCSAEFDNQLPSRGAGGAGSSPWGAHGERFRVWATYAAHLLQSTA